MTKKEMMDKILEIVQEVWEIEFSEEEIIKRTHFTLKHYNKYNLQKYYDHALYAQKLKKETGEILKFI